MQNDLVSNDDLSLNILPKISVFGIGGAGINAINNMILSQIDFDNVKFVVANTDCQSLISSYSETKIQLGAECTKGLGAGSKPEVGKQAAEESIERIKKELTNTNMLFIASGMGGGTGTGASPVVAKIAKEMGILTIAIVIKPFSFEGKKRTDIANRGVCELEKIVDALIVIENNKAMKLNPNLSMAECYAVADGFLKQAVYCIVSILMKKGYINRDFADLNTVLSSTGRAVIGYGEDIDVKLATNKAINNSILENSSIYGAKNILINITSATNNITPKDYSDIFEKIKQEAGINEENEDDSNIIFGNVFDDEMGDNIRVSVIATGLKTNRQDKYEDLKKIQIDGKKEDIDNNFKNIEKVDAPVFVKPINEDEIYNDESFNLNIEEIPDLNNFNLEAKNINFISLEEKKKINKNDDNRKKNEKKNKIENVDSDNNGNNLFSINNNNRQGIFSKLINSITQTSSYLECEDYDNITTKIEENDSEENIYDIPAIKRKVG